MMEPEALDKDMLVAVSLPLEDGESRRVEHTCGDGDKLSITRHSNGILAHCFRCKASAFIRIERPLKERIETLRRIETADLSHRDIRTIPDGLDDVQDWPLAARMWLYQMGFSNFDIALMPLKWSTTMERVIIPFGYQRRDGDERKRAWQARGFCSDRPKYISPRTNARIYAAEFGDIASPVIVLVEDIMSARKWAHSTEVWALMGTSMRPDCMVALACTRKPVVVMLDQDNAGQTAQAKIIAALGSIGVPVYGYHLSDKHDPKYVGYDRIATIVKGMAAQFNEPEASDEPAA